MIFEGDLGAIVWAHYAPAINDGFRASYRQLLRWNDEYPFIKFSLAEDGRPMLASEIPSERLDCDELGLALARVLALSDSLLAASKGWLSAGGRGNMAPPSSPAGVALLARFAGRIVDLERE